MVTVLVGTMLCTTLNMDHRKQGESSSGEKHVAAVSVITAAQIIQKLNLPGCDHKKEPKDK